MDTNKLLPLLSEMAVLVCVVEQGSFSKAAEKLGVAPSSISRSMHRLEHGLQEKLLERTTRKMTLTSIGKEVFILCREMLNSAQLAVSAAHSSDRRVSGTLRVAAPKALAKHKLTSIMLDFLERYPEVTVQFKVVDHFVDPISDEVDVIIHITETPIEGLVGKVLSPSPLVLCASSTYATSHGLPDTPEKLADHNCLCLGESPNDQIWSFSSSQRSLSVPVTGSFAVNHSEIRLAAVKKGHGISMFPYFVVESALESGQLVEILAEWDLRGKYQGDIVVQYAQSKYIPNQIKAFVEFLSTQFQA